MKYYIFRIKGGCRTLNEIRVRVDFKRGICRKEGISLVTGDYNSTKMTFFFDEDVVGTKILKIKDSEDNLVYADEIENDELVLVGKDGEGEIYSLFQKEGDYTFEISLYGEDSRITSAYDYITVRKEEIIEAYMPTFDALINTITGKINEVNNLDIEAEKEEKKTTITLTKKDGTQKEIEILDGEKGDSGIVLFHIDNNGHLIGESESMSNLTHYSINPNDGHLYYRI